MLHDFYKPVLEELNLPIPKEESYLRTSDGGFLMPITRYGITIRGSIYSPLYARENHGEVTSVPHVFSDHVLQPIGTFHQRLNLSSPKRLLQNEFRIKNLLGTHPLEGIVQIYPGLPKTLNEISKNVTNGIKETQKQICTDIEQGIKKDGYNLSDNKPPNIGIIQTPGAYSNPIEHYVVIDTGCISLPYFGEDTSLLNRPYNEDTLKEAAPIQHALYHGLRQAFHRSFISQESDSTAFFNACAAEKARGLLHSGWENIKEFEYHSRQIVADKAQSYEIQLRQEAKHSPSTPHPDIFTP